MKQEVLDTDSAGRNFVHRASHAANPAPPQGEPGVPLQIGAREGYRLLKQNEMVSRGDFVANGQSGFEPWEGPGGFQAGSFLKPIYRKHPNRRRPSKQTKANPHHEK